MQWRYEAMVQYGLGETIIWVNLAMVLLKMLELTERLGLDKFQILTMQQQYRHHPIH
jgi:hypothetical protein